MWDVELLIVGNGTLVSTTKKEGMGRLEKGCIHYILEVHRRTNLQVAISLIFHSHPPVQPLKQPMVHCHGSTITAVTLEIFPVVNNSQLKETTKIKNSNI